VKIAKTTNAEGDVTINSNTDDLDMMVTDESTLIEDVKSVPGMPAIIPYRVNHLDQGTTGDAPQPNVVQTDEGDELDQPAGNDSLLHRLQDPVEEIPPQMDETQDEELGANPIKG